jgi:hypothetical protein
MLTKDELFKTGDQKQIWQKYCGFLNLSLKDWMYIQEQLLLEQIEIFSGSQLAKTLMSRKPTDVSEFRRIVPLTTFDDYADYLKEDNDDILTLRPYCWCHTSGRGGTFKWVPYTDRAIENFTQLAVAMLILACATRKGEVNIGMGMRMLQNLPPPPYMAGIISRLLDEYMEARTIPPLDEYEDVDFQRKIEDGFKIALRTGTDMLTSLTSVLVKMGESFTDKSRQFKFSPSMLHPQTMWRLIRAIFISKREGRILLPKDLWPLKGLVCYGTDTGIYKEKLVYYWGKQPYETYAATEAGVIAMQAWNKKNMTLVPYSCFLEFIHESELDKSQQGINYQPSTMLIDEVTPGERYEIVITSFYGMPFLRYRLGDIVRIVALEDKETGINLPQMVFETRADDIIDIAGFPRLDEKTIWQAIVNSEIAFEEWTARKEYEQNEPILRIYIELKEERNVSEMEKLMHQELLALNRDYKDAESMLGMRPLRITTLPQGSFQRYLEKKQKAGYDLAHWKPRHINASDTVIQDLLKPNTNPS